MKKIAVLGTLAMLALVVPAQAARHSPKGHTPPPPTTPTYVPSYGPVPPGHSCMPHWVGYNATGTLVSSTLTKKEDGRYEGTLVVKVTRANHHAATGEQTYTLTDARVNFHHGVESTAPAVGSRVKVHGKISKLNKHCSQEGFTPTVMVKKVDIHQAPSTPNHEH